MWGVFFHCLHRFYFLAKIDTNGGHCGFEFMQTVRWVHAETGTTGSCRDRHDGFMQKQVRRVHAETGTTLSCRDRYDGFMQTVQRVQLQVCDGRKQVCDGMCLMACV